MTSALMKPASTLTTLVGKFLPTFHICSSSAVFKYVHFSSTHLPPPLNIYGIQQIKKFQGKLQTLSTGGWQDGWVGLWVVQLLLHDSGIFSSCRPFSSSQHPKHRHQYSPLHIYWKCETPAQPWQKKEEEDEKKRFRSKTSPSERVRSIAAVTAIISRGRSRRKRSPTAKFPTSIWLQHCGGGGNRYFLFADELGMRGTLPSYGLIDFHLPYLKLQRRCKWKLTSGKFLKTVVSGHPAVSALAPS